MKNSGYFMMGLILLPIRGVARLAIYIRDYGKDFVDMYKFEKKFNTKK